MTNDRDEWQERVWEIHASSMTWWWWWLASHNPAWFITLRTSGKSSRAADLCLRLPKYCETFDSPKYLNISTNIYVYTSWSTHLHLVRGQDLGHMHDKTVICQKTFVFHFLKTISIIQSLFGLVLWHINHCRLFNAKSSLYIHIKYIGFGFVGFYGISTIVGYLMPNPLYTYILNIYDLVWLGFMAYQPL